MIINEKKFKIYSTIFGILFIVIISTSFYYIYNIKNLKENETTSDKNVDINFEIEKNRDSVTRLLNNLDNKNIKGSENSKNDINNLTKKELLSKKILMSKMEDRKNLKLEYIKEVITNEEVIDLYLKYKKNNLEIDFKDFEILTSFFKDKELNNIIFNSYKKDFSSSVNNILNNYDLLDNIFKNSLKEINQEIFNFKEEKNNTYLSQKSEIENDKNLSIDDLKIKLMILRDNFNEEVEKYISTITEKEKIIKDKIDLLLRIYSKVTILEENDINKEILLDYNKELLMSNNQNLTFLYNMDYISELLQSKYFSSNSEDINFQNFVNIYLEDFKRPNLDEITTKTKEEIQILNIDIKKPFISTTNKSFGYENLTEEDINNIFKLLP